MDSYEIAFQLHTWGYSVIPSGGGDNGKAPLVDWKPYQTEQPSDAQMMQWQDTLQPITWGIVTTETTGLVDADGTDTRLELEQELGRPHVVTPRGGGHFYFDTTGHALPTRAGVLPNVDIRGVGGFVNIAGPGYEIVTLPHPDKLLPFDVMPERILVALNGRNKPPLEEGEPITQGKRNQTLASIAGSMRAKGLPEPAIEAALQAINQESCEPPLSEAEVKKIARSIATYPTNSGNSTLSLYCPGHGDLATESHKRVTEKVTNPEPLARRIRDWVTNTSGWFSYDEIDRDFGLSLPNEKHNRWMIVKRLRDDEGILESHPSNNKLLRHNKVATRLVDFKACGNRTPLAIKYPFGVERYFKTYPGNLIVLAGAADAGKTAFLLNLIRLNMGDFSVFYQTSEMGAEELASRLEMFQGLGLEDWSFTAEERSQKPGRPARHRAVRLPAPDIGERSRALRSVPPLRPSDRRAS